MSTEKHGYRAVQVSFGTRRPQLLTRAVAGHYAKANVAPGQGLLEFRLSGTDGADLKPGSELKVDLFSEGQAVDVTGVTIGKGFAGVIKRHHFAGGMASHGASLAHRVPGSIGQRQTPGRVFPGKRMSGHMIRGAVPGAEGGQVIVRASVKALRQAARKTIQPTKAAAAPKAAPAKAAAAPKAAPAKTAKPAKK
jgi:large subunit ribosomal protein L3